METVDCARNLNNDRFFRVGMTQSPAGNAPHCRNLKKRVGLDNQWAETADGDPIAGAGTREGLNIKGGKSL